MEEPPPSQERTIGKSQFLLEDTSHNLGIISSTESRHAISGTGGDHAFCNRYPAYTIDQNHFDRPGHHQNFYMALRALIALAELAPALSALSAPAAHSNLLTREYHGENMPCGMQMA